MRHRHVHWRVLVPLSQSRKLNLGCQASGVSEANMVDDDLDLNPTADSGQTANPVGQRTQTAADIAHGAEGGFDRSAPTVQRSAEE